MKNNDGTPIIIQKKLLSATPGELHNLIISDENVGGFAKARDENGNAVISEHVLQQWQPNWLKRMTSKYKQMCGCKVCVVTNNMQTSLNAWKYRKISSEKSRIAQLAMGDERDEVLSTLIEYEQPVLNEDGKSIYHQGWDAADSVGWGNVAGFQFPHFTCVMRECKKCPKYTIPCMEVNCDDLISYNIFESCYGCNNNGFDFIQIQ